MPSEERFDALTRDVTRLRVAHMRLSGKVETLSGLASLTDGHLRTDIEDLRAVVKELRGEVETLHRWRWQVIGAAGGVALVAAPLGQALLGALGVH